MAFLFLVDMFVISSPDHTTSCNGSLLPIHMDFDMGHFDMSSEILISDYRLKDGVFRNGNLFLKKLEKQPVKK